MFDFKNALTRVNKVSHEANAEKGPTMRVMGTVEDNEIVIRIPTTWKPTEVRETSGKDAKGNQRTPAIFAAITVEFETPPAITLTDGSEVMSLLGRQALNLNVFTKYVPETD